MLTKVKIIADTSGHQFPVGEIVDADYGNKHSWVLNAIRISNQIKSAWAYTDDLLAVKMVPDQDCLFA